MTKKETLREYIKQQTKNFKKKGGRIKKIRKTCFAEGFEPFNKAGVFVSDLLEFRQNSGVDYFSTEELKNEYKEDDPA